MKTFLAFLLSVVCSSAYAVGIPCIQHQPCALGKGSTVGGQPIGTADSGSSGGACVQGQSGLSLDAGTPLAMDGTACGVQPLYGLELDGGQLWYFSDPSSRSTGEMHSGTMSSNLTGGRLAYAQRNGALMSLDEIGNGYHVTLGTDGAEHFNVTTNNGTDDEVFVNLSHQVQLSPDVIGACPVGQVVIQINNNAPPTCGVASTTTGPLNFWVDGVLGNDSSSCAGPTTACRTVPAACAKVPREVTYPVNIYIDAGVFSGGGCALEGYSFRPSTSSAGAYIAITGTMIDAPDAGSGCVSTGAIASATNLVNAAFPTITYGGSSCWAASGLRQYLIEVDPLDGGLPEYLAAYDNTGTVITMAGQFAWTPLANDIFHIRTWGTIFDGGLTVPPNFPTQQQAINPQFSDAGMQAAFILSDDTCATISSMEAYNATNATNGGSCIYLQNLAAVGMPGALVRGAWADGINVRWSMWQPSAALTPGMFGISFGGGRNENLVGNYLNGTALAVDKTGLWGATAFGFNQAVLTGNVVDGAQLFGADSAPFNALAVSTSPVGIVTLANSIRNDSMTASMSPVVADMKWDVVDGTYTSDCAVRIGNLYENPSGGGGGSTVRMNGEKITTGGSCGALFFSGGLLTITGGATTPMNGSGATGFGIVVGPRAQVDIFPAGGSTLTGALGDTTLDGTNAISYASLTTLGRESNALLMNTESEGGTRVAGQTNMVGAVIGGPSGSPILASYASPAGSATISAPTSIGCATQNITCTNVTAGKPLTCSPSASPQTGNAGEVVTHDEFSTAGFCHINVCCASAICTAPPAVSYFCREFEQ